MWKWLVIVTVHRLCMQCQNHNTSLCSKLRWSSSFAPEVFKSRDQTFNIRVMTKIPWLWCLSSNTANICIGECFVVWTLQSYIASLLSTLISCCHTCFYIVQVRYIFHTLITVNWDKTSGMFMMTLDRCSVELQCQNRIFIINWQACTHDDNHK